MVQERISGPIWSGSRPDTVALPSTPAPILPMRAPIVSLSFVACAAAFLAPRRARIPVLLAKNKDGAEDTVVELPPALGARPRPPTP